MKAEFEKTQNAIIIMEHKEINMNDILDLIQSHGEEDFKFFSRDKALNVELTYNLLQHFQADNIIVF